MKTTKITVSTRKITGWSGDILVGFAKQHGKKRNILIQGGEDYLTAAGGLDAFVGRKDQDVTLYPPFGVTDEPLWARLLVIGLGEIPKKAQNTQVAELLRSAGGRLAAACRKYELDRMGIVLPELDRDPKEVAQFLTEGILLGDYRFQKYQTQKKSQYTGIKKLEFLVSKKAAQVRAGVARGEICAQAACVARDMANEPGNGWTPTHFADYARGFSKKLKLSCKVLEKSHMTQLGMGGILAVNQGSKEAPKLIFVDYDPGDAEETILLVGKGLTFDSGGVSLKPGKGMMDMKYDMCGGAVVLATLEAIGQLRPSVRVVGIVPSTDNMPGGAALKPGDIITHYNGMSAEIENTDAEGRLILADSLAWGIEKVKPSAVIDLATLTGAVIIGLGHHYTGMMSNNDSLVKKMTESATKAGEPVWRLPLGPAYAKQIESRVADIKNTGGRAGGSITAAEYLHCFVGKTPWVHLDIAGTAWDFTEKTYIPKGPSGTGVRTLIDLLMNW